MISIVSLKETKISAILHSIVAGIENDRIKQGIKNWRNSNIIDIQVKKNYGRVINNLESYYGYIEQRTIAQCGVEWGENSYLNNVRIILTPSYIIHNEELWKKTEELRGDDVDDGFVDIY